MSSRANAAETELRTCAAQLAARGSIETSSPAAGHAREIAALLPAGTRVYVPHLPRHALDASLPLIEEIRAAGLDPVPHIAARRIASAAEVEAFLGRAGVSRVLVIGGDEPRPFGPYADAAALLRGGNLAAAGVREVGISGYPEGHPAIPSDVLERAFEDKLALAAAQGLRAHVVTQFSFNAAAIVRYCATLARRDPKLPIRVGLAGPTEPMALLRFAKRCGVSASLRTLRAQGLGMAKLIAHTDPGQELLALARHCTGRAECNVAGVHLFGFGGAARSAAWMQKAAASGA